MKRSPVLVLCILAALPCLSCLDASEEDPPSINGTWNVTSADGAPPMVSNIQAMTIVISGSSSFTYSKKVQGSSAVTFTGTVTKQSEYAYRLVSTIGVSATLDVALADDGLTITVWEDSHTYILTKS